LPGACPVPIVSTCPTHPAFQVNGEPRPLPPGHTVAALLADIGLDRRKVAVELDEEIVPRSRYESTPLDPGDRLEIVHFIGGG
jgi:thiamine biosynthesis protein ThiS